MKSAMALPETRCLIDASALIALIDEDDLFSKKAMTVFEHIKSHQIQSVISDFTLQETFTILLYKQKGHLISSAIALLREDPLFELMDIDIQTLLNTVAFAKKNSFKPKMSITDWTLAYLSTDSLLPLITFDKQLRNFCKKLS